MGASRGPEMRDSEPAYPPFTAVQQRPRFRVGHEREEKKRNRDFFRVT